MNTSFGLGPQDKKAPHYLISGTCQLSPRIIKYAHENRDLSCDRTDHVDFPHFTSFHLDTQRHELLIAISTAAKPQKTCPWLFIKPGNKKLQRVIRYSFQPCRWRNVHIPDVSGAGEWRFIHFFLDVLDSSAVWGCHLTPDPHTIYTIKFNRG